MGTDDDLIDSDELHRVNWTRGSTARPIRTAPRYAARARGLTVRLGHQAPEALRR